jgi:DNA-binding NarL/FixJ family response regulator
MRSSPEKPRPKQAPGVTGLRETGENAGPLGVSKIRVFLVIENRLLRDMLAHVVRRQEDLELSGKSGSGETNPEQVAKSGCDVALLDFVDPEWLSMVRNKSREMGDAIRTVVIGMEAENATFLEAVRSGVTGYLLMDATAADVMAAVRAAFRGEASCPPQLCTLLFQTVAQIEADRGSEKAAKKGLTLRQQKLMKLVAKGMTNKEIAAELGLSEFTVRNHMSRILKQTYALNRSAAVEAARESGYDMSL